MKYLVVGLGNPGNQYENTRHNVGYKVIDTLCSRSGSVLSKETPSSMACSVFYDGEKVMLAKPTTYMNDSGIGVGEIMRRYKLESESLIVVHDELDLELGLVRLKKGGGLAGHNGLKSIDSHIKSKDFIRVRIGISKPPSKDQGASHVLKPFGKKEQELIDHAVEVAADAVEKIINESLDAAMRIYHTS